MVRSGMLSAVGALLLLSNGCQGGRTDWSDIEGLIQPSAGATGEAAGGVGGNGLEPSSSGRVGAQGGDRASAGAGLGGIGGDAEANSAAASGQGGASGDAGSGADANAGASGATGETGVAAAAGLAAAGVGGAVGAAAGAAGAGATVGTVAAVGWAGDASAGASGWAGAAGDPPAGAAGAPEPPPECVPGDARTCYFGPPATRGVGECRDGIQTCQGSHWEARLGACRGQVIPLPDQPDTGLDEDCNGTVDDACSPGTVHSCSRADAEHTGVGLCALGTAECIAAPDGSTHLAQCTALAPAPESWESDGIDDDCDGFIDDQPSAYAETVWTPQGFAVPHTNGSTFLQRVSAEGETLRRPLPLAVSGGTEGAVAYSSEHEQLALVRRWGLARFDLQGEVLDDRELSISCTPTRIEAVGRRFVSVAVGDAALRLIESSVDGTASTFAVATAGTAECKPSELTTSVDPMASPEQIALAELTALSETEFLVVWAGSSSARLARLSDTGRLLGEPTALEGTGASVVRVAHLPASAEDQAVTAVLVDDTLSLLDDDLQVVTAHELSPGVDQATRLEQDAGAFWVAVSRSGSDGELLRITREGELTALPLESLPVVRELAMGPEALLLLFVEPFDWALPSELEPLDESDVEVFGLSLALPVVLPTFPRPFQISRR